MDWSAIQALAEAIGAAAVVLSLLYLGRQVRHGTEATQAATVMRAVEIIQDSRRALWADLEGAKVWNAAVASVEHDDALLNSRVRMFWNDLGRAYEAIYFQWRAGQLPHWVWRGLEQEIRLVWCTPGGRMAIRVFDQDWMNPDFVAWIKEMQDAAAPNDFTEWRARWKTAAAAVMGPGQKTRQ